MLSHIRLAKLVAAAYLRRVADDLATIYRKELPYFSPTRTPERAVTKSEAAEFADDPIVRFFRPGQPRINKPWARKMHQYLISRAGHPFSLWDAVEQTGLPKMDVTELLTAVSRNDIIYAVGPTYYFRPPYGSRAASRRR